MSEDMFAEDKDRLEVLQELHRELNMRLTVYPKWVKDGRLTQATADRRCELIAKAIEIIGAET